MAASSMGFCTFHLTHHTWINPGCAEGLAPEENVCEDHARILAVPLRGRTLQAGMLEHFLDAGECFIKLHVILSYVFDSLVLYLADTFGSVGVSSVKFNSQGRLSSDTSQIPIKKL